MTYEVQLQLGSVQYIVRGPETDGVLSLIERLQTIGRPDPTAPTLAEMYAERQALADEFVAGLQISTPLPKIEESACEAPSGYEPGAEPEGFDGHDYEGFPGGCARMGCASATPLPKIEEPTGAWIEWTGTTSPVRAHAKVQVKLASGYESGIVPAHTVEWNTKSGSHYAIAAYRVVKPEPSDEGWIMWTGGRMPVEAGTRVCYLTRSDYQGVRMAEHIQWSRGDSSCRDDIVAYKVLAPCA